MKNKKNDKMIGLLALGAALTALEAVKEIKKHQKLKKMERRLDGLIFCHNGFVSAMHKRDEEISERMDTFEDEVGTCYEHIDALAALLPEETEG